MQNFDNSRKMEGVNFSGATFKGNTNFQSDQNNQAYQEAAVPEFEKLFTALLEEINKLTDEDERTDAVDDSNKLKDAIQNGKWERAKNLIGRLPEAIKTASAATTIIKFIASAAGHPIL